MAGGSFSLTSPNQASLASQQGGYSPSNQQGLGHTPTTGIGSFGAGGSSGTGVPRLGPTRKASAGAVVEGRWLGLNMAVAPERLTGLESPDLLNMNTWSHPASLSTRMCRGKCAEKATRAEGVCLLPTSFVDSDGVRNVVMVSWSASVETLEIKKLTLPAKPERGLFQTPAVTLTSPSTGNIRVALSPLATVGGIESVLCCWSANGYPTSPWSIDSRRNTEGRAENAWFGVTNYSQDMDVSGEVASAALAYVSVWLVSRTGLSPAFHGTVTVA